MEIAPGEEVESAVCIMPGYPVGTHNETIVITFSNGVTASIETRFTVRALTYSIGASPATLEFVSVQEGYRVYSTSKDVTITNTGTGAVTLSRPTPAKYDVSTNQTGVPVFPTAGIAIPAKGSVKLYVRPVTGLAVGTHDETIVFSGSNGATASVGAKLSVIVSGGGVTIGGVTWAARNVGWSRQFVDRPEEYGGYFSFSEAEAATACPEGWRAPTQAELSALGSGSWETLNGVNGRRFGSGTSTIFLPAAGQYDLYNDVPDAYQGTFGLYWSTTQSNNTDGRCMMFSNNYFNPNDQSPKYMGLSIRCVKK
jgi:uncharacterized protein (TIGR02145 family)